MNIKKEKCVNRNAVAKMQRHDKYKDVLLTNKCLRHSMNRIQSKDHRIRIYEIKKTSLSPFEDKIYIQNNGNVGLALAY